MKTWALILATVWVLPVCAPQAAVAQSGAGDVIHVSVKGDRLAFASIEDYKRAVEQPSRETREQFSRAVAALKGFTSFAQKQSSAAARQAYSDKVGLLIPDEYFASILNSNLVVQIGDSIIRVNPSKERVYVLPAANEKEYGDLIAGNARNKHIRVFSTSDDVLEAIQAGERGSRRALNPALAISIPRRRRAPLRQWLASSGTEYTLPCSPWSLRTIRQDFRTSSISPEGSTPARATYTTACGAAIRSVMTFRRAAPGSGRTRSFNRIKARGT